MTYHKLINFKYLRSCGLPHVALALSVVLFDILFPFMTLYYQICLLLVRCVHLFVALILPDFLVLDW